MVRRRRSGGQPPVPVIDVGNEEVAPPCPTSSDEDDVEDQNPGPSPRRHFTNGVTLRSTTGHTYRIRKSLRTESPPRHPFSRPRQRYVENDRGEFVDVDMMEDLEENSFQWSQSVHPLLIPDVVASIMSHLEFSDFKNTSLICKVWLEECQRKLANKGKIHLDSFEHLGEFLSKNEDVQHRNKFTHFRLGQHLNLQDAMVQRLFSKFGPNITFLHLDWTHFIPASLRKILFEKLPSLEELIICSERIANTSLLPSTAISPDGSVIAAPPSQNKLPNVKILRIESRFQSTECKFLLELLSVMPNLEVISGYHSMNLARRPELSRNNDLRYEQCDTGTDRLLNVGLVPTDAVVDADLLISQVLYTNQLVRNFKLKSLKTVFDGEALMILRRSDLPLESLELVIPSHTFQAWHPRPSHLFSTISTFAKTLKSLKLNYCSGKLKLLSIFDGCMRLRGLAHLSLHRCSGNLDFLAYIPQLKSLHMTQEEFIEYYDEFHLEEGRPHKLEVLKLYYTSWSVSSLYVDLPRPGKILNVVQIIIQRFPNLKSFRMESLTDKAMASIYTGLPQLEELEATNGSYTSSGISGIPVIQQGQCFGTVLHRPCPHIGLLSNLKSLRLESNKLTDFGLTSTVITLPSLTHLRLLCYKLTDESLLAVVRRLELKVLKTEFCYEFSKPVIEWANKTLRDRGSKTFINPFCSSLEDARVHDFLNENGPIHVSIPDFPGFS